MLADEDHAAPILAKRWSLRLALDAGMGADRRLAHRLAPETRIAS